MKDQAMEQQDDRTPLERAKFYLLHMRDGVLESKQDNLVYPHEIEWEIRDSGKGREEALKILDTDDQELTGFRYAYKNACAREAAQTLRSALRQEDYPTASASFRYIFDYIHHDDEFLHFEDDVLEQIGMFQEEYDEYKRMFMPEQYVIDIRQRELDRLNGDEPFGRFGFSMN